MALLAHITFDNPTAAILPDATGNNFDAIRSGSAPVSVPGFRGRAAQISGSTHWQLGVAGDALGNIAASSAGFTVAFFLKYEPTPGESFLVATPVGTSYRSFGIWIGSGTLNVKLVRPNGSKVSQAYSGDFSAGRHVAVVYDRLGQLFRLYINGTQVNAVVCDDVRDSTVEAMHVGSLLGGLDAATATLDDLRFYDSPIAPAEVAALAVIDTTPPVVTLQGGNPATIEQGATWSDPGATATDDNDGDISGEILVSGSVDTSTPGTYQVVYVVTDGAGNQTIATRSVIVTPPADTTPPFVTLNGSEIVTIEEGQTFTDPGATATDETDGELAVVVSGSVDTATPGSYVLTYTATDTSGNSANATRSVTVTAAAPPAPPPAPPLDPPHITRDAPVDYTEPYSRTKAPFGVPIFEGENNTAREYRFRFVVRPDYFEPLPIGSEHPTIEGAFLVEETPPTLNDSILLEWERVYCTIPEPRVDYVQTSYAFPGFKANAQSSDYSREPLQKLLVGKKTLTYVHTENPEEITLNEAFQPLDVDGNEVDFVAPDTTPTLNQYKNQITAETQLLTDSTTFSRFRGNIWEVEEITVAAK